MKFKKFFKELKRRNVFRETLAYLAVAWLILQVAQTILPNIGAPDWIFKSLIYIFIGAIPFVILVSWLYQLTNRGLKKTSDFNSEAESKSYKKRMNLLITVSTIIALIFFVGIGYKVRELNEVPPYSIAIMPFKDLSPNDEQSWFLDGLREDIWERFSRIEEMTPISNRSTESEILENKSIKEVLEQLNVKYLLDGSVRIDKDIAYIDIKLWNNEEELVWKEDYAENIEDLFKVQKMLSWKIVEAMEFKIDENEDRILSALDTHNLDAYLKVRDGIINIRDNSPGEAIPYFEEALELDSTYANAYSGLAYAYSTLGWHFEKDKHFLNLAKTKEYAAKALELDINNSRAYSVLSVHYSIVEKRPKLALEYTLKAIESQPNSPLSHYEAGLSYMLLNPVDTLKSLYHHKRAYELEPLDWKNIRELQQVYTELDRYEEAREIILKSAAILGESRYNYYNAVVDAFELGNRSPITNLHLKELQKDSLNPNTHWDLAGHYGMFLNDVEASLKHAKKVYELDKKPTWRVIYYINLLIQNKNFDEARKMLKTSSFKKESNVRRGATKFNLLYQSNDLEGLKILMDSMDYYEIGLKDQIFYRIKKGEIKNPKDIDSISWVQLTLNEKARIFAEMGRRDSLYACLKDPLMRAFYWNVNSSASMDPYRNDPEYLEFKKTYLLQ